MTLSAHLLVHRSRRIARRAARQRRRELEWELACCSRPSDRHDLEATLDRYPDGVTYELRDILARQAWARQEQRWPAIGRR